MRVSPTIIFTKFEHLVNDIKSKIIEQEEEQEIEFTSEEKEIKIISRSTEVITEFMNKVLFELPKSKFFIFNPLSKQYGYKFEYN
jgi:hypothetical protein